MDDTLCEYTDNSNRDGMMYEKAIPKLSNIAIINNMFNHGHTITIWTSRGVVTGIDWTAVTKQQLQTWNVKYHTLECTKPYFDLFLDDKALNSIHHFDEEWIQRVLTKKHLDRNIQTDNACW